MRVEQKCISHRSISRPVVGIRLDIESWNDQVNGLVNSDRPAVSLGQRARPGIMVQETPHG
jgi:hypothetical protein